MPVSDVIRVHNGFGCDQDCDFLAAVRAAGPNLDAVAAPPYRP
jgi:hypothetical protein